MRINILQKGDSVICVNNNRIIVRRRKGEVDIIPIIDDMGLRVDVEHIITIGYGENTIEADLCDEDITVVNF